MKIVIDIPDWRYKSICKGIEATKRCGVVGPDPVIHEAIYKGMPFPEGHGRLIDEKEAIGLIAEGKNGDKAYFGTVNKDWEVIDFFKTLSTIIEADEEEKK